MVNLLNALTRPLPALFVAALVTACATTEVDPEYEEYTEQMKLNQTRYESCTKGYVAQYSKSETASNAKVITAAMKQCALYATNYCHAQVQRDAHVAKSGVLPPAAEASAEAACLQTFNGELRTTLRAQLARSRPQGATPGTAQP